MYTPDKQADWLRGYLDLRMSVCDGVRVCARVRKQVRNVSKGVSEAQLKAFFHDTVVKAMAGKDDAGMGTNSQKLLHM